MNDRMTIRIAGVAGILWPVLAVSRLPFTGEIDMPEWTAPPSDFIEFYEGSSFDTSFKFGIGMAVVAYVLLIVFLARIAVLLRDIDVKFRWLGNLLVAGSVVDSTLVAGYLATISAATFRASHGGHSGDGYVALYDLSLTIYWVGLIAANLWIVPFGVAILVAGILPRWLGWLVLVNAPALLVAFFLSVDVWNAISGLPYLWVLIAAIVMLRRADQYEEPDLLFDRSVA